MPVAVPTTLPPTTASTPALPAAVEAVWSPWPPWPLGSPSESRGELNSDQCCVVWMSEMKASKPLLK